MTHCIATTLVHYPGLSSGEVIFVILSPCLISQHYTNITTRTHYQSTVVVSLANHHWCLSHLSDLGHCNAQTIIQYALVKLISDQTCRWFFQCLAYLVNCFILMVPTLKSIIVARTPHKRIAISRLHLIAVWFMIIYVQMVLEMFVLQYFTHS